MVSGAHGDAFGVEGFTDFDGVVAGEHEGQHAGLLFGGPDQAHPGDGGQPWGGVVQQGVFVGGDPVDTDLFDVADRFAQSDGIGDVSGAGLELVGQALIQGAFDGDIGDHVAPALPGRRLGQHLFGAVEHADPGGPEDLVPGEHQEVGPGLGDVDRDVRDRLGASMSTRAP